uniref:Uncharacterized protein n=1 Tax=Manihot esculenta TaxID=3983 RepID=A0A2C9UNY3_MANES
MQEKEKSGQYEFLIDGMQRQLEVLNLSNHNLQCDNSELKKELGLHRRNASFFCWTSYVPCVNICYFLIVQ